MAISPIGMNFLLLAKRIPKKTIKTARMMSVRCRIWMTLAYVIPPELQGRLLFWVRLAVGSGMAMALILAIRAIRGGNVLRHQAWMLRAYALGQGAGTQVLFLLPPQLFLGEAVTGMPRDLLMTAAWAANVLIAESVLRTQETKAPRGLASGSPREASQQFSHAADPATFGGTP